LFITYIVHQNQLNIIHLRLVFYPIPLLVSKKQKKIKKTKLLNEVLVMNNCSILSCCRYCFKTIIKIINLRTKSQYFIFNKKTTTLAFQTVEIILIFLHLNIHLNLQFFQSKQMVCFIGININLLRNYIFFKPMKIRTKSNSIFNLNQ
jgi:hypothetical protein